MMSIHSYRVALGCDHRGAKAVHSIADHLAQSGHEALLLGDTTEESHDYPDSAWLVGRALIDGRADFGVLICGSGIGISIAANKMPGIRAALAVDVRASEMSRRHNNANVLCLPGDRITPEECLPLVDAFLAASFEGGRHARRVDKFRLIEEGIDPSGVSAAS